MWWEGICIVGARFSRAGGDTRSVKNLVWVVCFSFELLVGLIEEGGLLVWVIMCLGGWFGWVVVFLVLRIFLIGGFFFDEMI